MQTTDLLSKKNKICLYWKRVCREVVSVQLECLEGNRYKLNIFAKPESLNIILQKRNSGKIIEGLYTDVVLLW